MEVRPVRWQAASNRHKNAQGGAWLVLTSSRRSGGSRDALQNGAAPRVEHLFRRPDQLRRPLCGQPACHAASAPIGSEARLRQTTTERFFSLPISELPLSKWRIFDVNLRSGPQIREYESIVERIAQDAPDRLLDWGCGWSQVTALLGRAGLDVSAFDYRPGLEKDGLYPLERYPDINAFLSADPVKLPYEADSLNAVLSCGVLEHVGDPDGSLDEIHRILAPGETLYVYKLPNRYSYVERLAKAAGVYYHGLEPNDRMYSKRSAVRLLERHGFRVCEFQRTNMLPLNLTSFLGSRLTGPVWAINRLLARIPVANLVSTNLELVATIPR